MTKFSRRHAGVFFKGADKVGIVGKAAALAGLGDGFSLVQQFLGQGDAL